MKEFLTSRFLCVPCHGLYIAHAVRGEFLHTDGCDWFAVQNLQSIGSHVLKLSFTPLQALIFMSVLKRITSTQTLNQELLTRRCYVVFLDVSGIIIDVAPYYMINGSLSPQHDASSGCG